MTIPGSTAWDIASPTITILRSTKKHPNILQGMATRQAVRIIHKSLTIQISVDSGYKAKNSTGCS